MKILTNTRAVISTLAVAGLATAGLALGAAPAQAAPTSVWDRVAACESGGNWSIDTGNGYYGGLQFSLATWHGYGGTGNPAAASKSTQIAIAEKVLAGQGWGAWPVCSVKAGATGSSSSASSSSSSASSSSRSTSSSHEYSSHSSTPSRTTSSSPAPRAAVAAAPARPAAVKTSGETYTIKSGDSLSKIAQRLDIDGGWQRLWAANPKVGDPNLIFTGQKLQLPA
ncbi:transglycosylase family protein [Amnibacterium kyonggiense]|uniref:LysM domain-containing protein n=1 Tax=Amnibacterium kyonggiense TaxID=595671 RepID=A0A4R7FMC9_9MICO|nr:transglycosylase family protein [Amnibacterium kyonggiense]TDS77566.1 LysM domain-containing protein [Amnibacterium kyonggiense]